MYPLPANDLRRNLGTWAVPVCQVPAVAALMIATLPAEELFDPDFEGQPLRTTYFDTLDFALRQARHKGKNYLTLRVRQYPNGMYALSVKTEDVKFRIEVEPWRVDLALNPGDVTLLIDLLPGDLRARLLELIDHRPLRPVVSIRATRYAVENAQDRLTLDLAVRTDTGKCLEMGVLEFKSTQPGASPPDRLDSLALRPIKLSKFLWATLWR